MPQSFCVSCGGTKAPPYQIPGLIQNIFNNEQRKTVLQNNFAERILDDSGGSGGLEPGDDIADDGLVEDGVERDPGGIAEVRDGWRVERGKLRDDAVEVGFARVEHESDAALRGDGGVEHQRDILDLAALPWVGEGGFVGDELGL